MKTISLVVMALIVSAGIVAAFFSWQASSAHLAPNPAASQQAVPSSAVITPVSEKSVALDASSSNQSAVAAQSSLDLIPGNLTQLFTKVENSVVQITSTITTTDQNIIINGNPIQGQQTVLGSGFIYDTQGHIITNYHVVQGATNSTVDVTFTDGNVYTARIVGQDPYSDLAVLQLNNVNVNTSSNSNSSTTTAPFTETLTPLPLLSNNTSTIEVGQEIVAIGNPFGLSGSMTHGIISQKDRVLPDQNSGYAIPGVIQVDAPINPGNSGGPLLDLQGRVIGVTSAIYSQTGTFSGVGFAIPSSTLVKEIPVLAAGKQYQHPWLGIVGTDITADIAAQLGLKQPRGVIIVSLTPDSPAASAGFSSGSKPITTQNGVQINSDADIIVGIDGKQVRKTDDIINYIDSKSVGDTVMVKVMRAGAEKDIAVKLGARPSPSSTTQ
jgi:S1-C subfamily serine protease